MSGSGGLVIFLCCWSLLSGLTSCQPVRETPPALHAPESAIPAPSLDKWSLWTGGTHLRGANIYQRKVYPELDGTEFLGPGPFGPPYTQQDFDHLAAMGANYVNISHPGLFTETLPYIPDPAAQANLDNLLRMIAKADMFAVITFRTGPGRSEFSILGTGDWAPESYLNETLWQDRAAQDAWTDMWRYTADRYRDDPYIVGYDLMCEPNSNARPDIWNPADFYAQYGGTLRDWNLLYPRLVAAIREVDTGTPILIGGNGYSSPEWLPFLQSVEAARIVYTLHQYNPHAYTHQEAQLGLSLTYPGYFDANYDGQPDEVNRLWLGNMLSPVVDFQEKYAVPLAVNEFGLERWEPGAADFLRDEMTLFEAHGWNYALWQWYASWPPLVQGDNSFNFRLGSDANDLKDVPSNKLINAIKGFWALNTIRPANLNSPSP